jgi:hypothetical protein
VIYTFKRIRKNDKTIVSSIILLEGLDSQLSKQPEARIPQYSSTNLGHLVKPSARSALLDCVDTTNFALSEKFQKLVYIVVTASSCNIAKSLKQLFYHSFLSS